jgi:hypothetical protein
MPHSSVEERLQPDHNDDPTAHPQAPKGALMEDAMQKTVSLVPWSPTQKHPVPRQSSSVKVETKSATQESHTSESVCHTL